MDRYFSRRHQKRGVSYSLEQFTAEYDLDDEKAEDLFYRYGP